MDKLKVQTCRWHAFPNEQALLHKVSKKLPEFAEESIRQRGAFRIVLAGGNTPRPLYRMLRDIPAQWSAWHIYWGDERCVPVFDPERNSFMAMQDWLDHVPIPREQIHPIAAELGAQEAANAYAQILKDVPDFDLVILGMGEDGHTASLFPGRDWGSSIDSPDVLPVHNAPKPPVDRVSMSAQRLGRALSVMALVSGQSKLEALQKWRNGARLPITSICPKKGMDVFITAFLPD